MANPVDLDKLVVALAASMVNARRYLDQATLGLQDVYAASDTLSALPRPRFNLDGMECDIAYVVETIDEPAAEPPAPTVRPDVVLTERELASLKRGTDEETQQRLAALLTDYRAAKSAVRTEGGADFRLSPAVRLEAEQLTALKVGASQYAVKKLDRLLEDYTGARTSLVRMREVVAGGGVPRLRVRLDAGAINEAPEAARQRVKLAFRSTTVEPVKVEGQTVDPT